MLLTFFLIGPVLQVILFLQFADANRVYEERQCDESYVKYSYNSGKVDKWQLIYFNDKPDIEFQCNTSGGISRKKNWATMGLSWHIEFLFFLSAICTILFCGIVVVSPFLVCENEVGR